MIGSEKILLCNSIIISDACRADLLECPDFIRYNVDYDNALNFGFENTDKGLVFNIDPDWEKDMDLLMVEPGIIDVLCKHLVTGDLTFVTNGQVQGHMFENGIYNKIGSID